MTIQETLEKSIEGGYLGETITGISESNGKWLFGTPIQTRLLTKNIEEILLDPSFWKSLGKAMGWGVEDGFDLEAMSKGGSPVSIKDEKDYLHYWHRLIDHLADGGSI